MKTAISIPDELFQRAEKLARRTQRSRSQLVGDALREYLARHTDNEITQAMNEVVAAVGEETDDFVIAAGRHTLGRVEW